MISYHFDVIGEHVEPLKLMKLATRESIPKNKVMLDESRLDLKKTTSSWPPCYYAAVCS